MHHVGVICLLSFACLAVASESNIKRGWNELSGMWGKRGWNDLSGMWGKRGWNDLSGMWGKRSLGKRNWNNLSNMWGKRFSPEMSEGSRFIEEYGLRDIDPADLMRMAEDRDRRQSDWTRLIGGWGRREIDANQQHLADLAESSKTTNVDESH